MQVQPTFYQGSSPVSLTLPPKGAATLQVTVDGAHLGGCLVSLDPPLEELNVTMTAHVDSFGVALVVFKNESEESTLINGTVRVTCVETAELSDGPHNAGDGIAPPIP